jgi:hypothetical protein
MGISSLFGLLAARYGYTTFSVGKVVMLARRRLQVMRAFLVYESLRCFIVFVRSLRVATPEARGITAARRRVQ